MSAILFCLFGSTQTPASQLDRSTPLVSTPQLITPWFGLSLFRPSRRSNIFTLGEERFKYPLPRENKISQMPYTPGSTKKIKSPPHALSSPPPSPPPRRHNIARCITRQWSVDISFIYLLFFREDELIPKSNDRSSCRDTFRSFLMLN